MMQFTTVSKLLCKGTTFCRNSQGFSLLKLLLQPLLVKWETERTASVITDGGDVRSPKGECCFVIIMSVTVIVVTVKLWIILGTGLMSMRSTKDTGI